MCAGVGGVRAEVTIKGEHKGGFWGDGLVCIQIIVVVTQIIHALKFLEWILPIPQRTVSFTV